MQQRSPRRQVSRLPPERRIADIMTAAREIFTEKGYTEHVISEIAERAGVVEGTIYRFFANKNDLLQQVAEAWFQEMMDQSAAHYEAIRGEWNALHFVIFHTLEAIRRDPGLTRLILYELRPEPDHRDTRLYALHYEYTGRLCGIVREGMERGVFRPDADPDLVRDMAFGAIEMRTWSYLHHKSSFEPGPLAREITDMLYTGLLPAAAPAQRDETLRRLEAVTLRLETLAGETQA
ncbi:TetR/AcrR family transcriptional regulator [Falsigemmobacter faecalis]|uniref:TetR/AcrR family transcriptional regulator n=1 Tax=Falsigemmobacter faecalis TaxID=2488730 RepID=A0A3P3D6Y5_9RHOB|nr:TetR/AcrR family transcriptional regulator [Falsigemmobacter faecalis]RRH70089.1 TetR/AcrR family transcriptional regulator [Falsigemmobacter faecalis]